MLVRATVALFSTLVRATVAPFSTLIMATLEKLLILKKHPITGHTRVSLRATRAVAFSPTHLPLALSALFL